MSISFVQSKEVSFGAAQSSVTATFTSGIATGSIILFATFGQNLATGITMSDNNSDSPTISFGPSTGASGALTVVGGFLTPTAGTTSVTTTFTGGTPNFGELIIWEVAGLTSASFDQKASAGGTTVAASSGNTGTLAATAEAAIGYIQVSGVIQTAGSGWTSDGIISSTGSLAQHMVTSGTSPIASTATTLSGSTWWSIVQTVKGASSLPPFFSTALM